ncbi:MAG: hypothetical protein ACTSUQ_07880 [Candidatus Freyarchaeota archaeon]
MWLRGGVRSYVERWFRTVKDRLRVFNCAFPRSPEGLERARTFIRLYAFRLQPHPPPPLPRRPATAPHPGKNPHPETAKGTGGEKTLKLTIPVCV